MSRLRPSLPGCPEPLLEQAVVDAAIVFCEDSLAMQETLDSFPTVSGVAEYALDTPAYCSVERILTVHLNSSRVNLFPADAAPHPGADAPSGAYTKRVDGELLLVLVPTPSKAETVYVKAVLRPIRGAKFLLDDLFELWMEPIVLGAYASLAAIPGQPFTEPLGASRASARFMSLSRQARVRSSYGAVRATQRIAPHPFA